MVTAYTHGRMAENTKDNMHVTVSMELVPILGQTAVDTKDNGKTEDNMEKASIGLE